MTNNKRVPVTAISAIIVIGITLLTFFMLVKEPEKIDYYAVGYAVAAELVFFLSMILTEVMSFSTFARAGTYTVSTIYLIVSLVLAIIFMNLHEEKFKYLVVSSSIITGVAVILLMIIIVSGKSIDRKTMATKAATGYMKEIYSKALYLQQSNNIDTLAGSLKKLSEALNYCDVSVNVETDDSIFAVVCELEQLLDSDTVETEPADSLINRALQLVKKREIEVKSIKSA